MEHVLNLTQTTQTASGFRKIVNICYQAAVGHHLGPFL